MERELHTYLWQMLEFRNPAFNKSRPGLSNRNNTEPMIMNAKKILCPIDFSDLSILGLRQAAKIAKANDAELVVMHVSDDFFRADKSSGYYTESMSSFMEQIKQLRSVVRELHDIRSSTHHCLGSPAVEIVDYAKKESCDLIVVGSHGRSGLTKLVFGSVTDKVINTAETNVLIVKPSDEQNVNSAASLDHPLVVPFDFSNAAKLTMEFARQWASQPSELYCVHVSEPAPAFDAEGFSRQKRESVIRGENRDKFYAELSTGDSGKVNFRTFFDYDIAKRIKQFAEDIQARLIVVPTNQKNFLERFFIGSVAKSIAQQAPCPTLILKTAGPSQADSETETDSDSNIRISQ